MASWSMSPRFGSRMTGGMLLARRTQGAERQLMEEDQTTLRREEKASDLVSK